MYISKCNRSDLPAIQELMEKYNNKCVVTADHLNKRDIALQARLETGELIGFIWCGLLANNTVAYMDKVAVDPAHSGNGVIHALYEELFKMALAKGVKDVEGYIRHDDFHLKSCKAAVRMGLGGDNLSYTRVYSSLNKMKKELGMEI